MVAICYCGKINTKAGKAKWARWVTLLFTLIGRGLAYFHLIGGGEESWKNIGIERVSQHFRAALYSAQCALCALTMTSRSSQYFFAAHAITLKMLYLKQSPLTPKFFDSLSENVAATVVSNITVDVLSEFHFVRANKTNWSPALLQ